MKKVIDVNLIDGVGRIELVDIPPAVTKVILRINHVGIQQNPWWVRILNKIHIHKYDNYLTPELEESETVTPTPSS